MKFITTIIILASVFYTDPRRIAKINSIKKDAEKAFTSKDFKTALEKYTFLKDSMKVNNENITLNIAHAKYQLKDSTAINNYQSLTSSTNKNIKSVAFQQLGVISKDKNKLQEAVDYLKQSIKSNPQNKAARYNYEVVKKLLEKQKKDEKKNNQDEKDQQNQQDKDENNQKNQNKDKEQNDKNGEEKDDKNKKENQQGDQDKQEKKEDGKEQEKKDEKESEGQESQGNEEQKKGAEEQKDGKDKKEAQQSQENKDSDKKGDPKGQMNQEMVGIPEEKARPILEAMRQNEIKYLQNKRRRPTKRPSSNKPDW